MILRLLTGLSLAAALAACLVLGGCGGVEFQGKLFDYAGLSGDRTPKDPKMAERAPLVLPPDTNTLPPPGEPPTYAAREDWPADTDAERKKVAAAAKAKQDEREAQSDPTNPYAGKPTLLDRVFGKKKDDEEDVAAVPEPDPSDKTPEDKERQQKAVAANGAPKPLDQPIIEAPKQEEDPFHPAAPDSYKQMSGQNGN
ncbi:MAG: hypothetical protein ACXWJ4_12445 [Methyloceanibacter sp.]